MFSLSRKTSWIITDTFGKSVLQSAILKNKENTSAKVTRCVLSKPNFYSFSTLVFAESTNKTVANSSTFSAINAAKKFHESVSVVVFGGDTNDVCTDISKVKDVNEVIHIKDDVYNYLLSDITAECIYNFLQKNKCIYNRLLGCSTARTKDIFPRVAALLDVQPITDVTDIIDKDTFVRPTYAGNIFANVRSKDKFKVITVRNTCFSQSIERSEVMEEKIKVFEEKDVNILSKMKFVKETFSDLDKPQLSNAKVVVSGGRGFRSKEEFEKHLIPLCEKLNAAIGASRAAVDAGFANNELQVGQTGKMVAPDLYIAVGISGAIQHIAGMQDSKIIVAINKDEDSPIFKTCDYGLVGDLFSILPELTNKLNKQHAQ